jgi:hypothetical protein
MSRRALRTWTIAVMLTVAGTAFLPSALSQESGLSALLPKERNPELEGWSPVGSPQEFKGDDLFVYIDGGAEIYLEYGFSRAVVQDYGDAGGRTVSLELFEMTDPAAAFGAYSFKTTGKGRALDLGQGGQLEDYYLNFWRGEYLITITGFNDDQETVGGLLAVAKAADHTVPGEGRHPPIIDILPAEGLDSGSVLYFRGRLGLKNAFPLASPGNLEAREGVRARYGQGQLVVLDCGQGEPVRKSFNKLKAIFQGGESFKNFVESESVIGAADDKGTPDRASIVKDWILITAGLEPETSEDLMNSIRRKL